MKKGRKKTVYFRKDWSLSPASTTSKKSSLKISQTSAKTSSRRDQAANQASGHSASQTSRQTSRRSARQPLSKHLKKAATKTKQTFSHLSKSLKKRSRKKRQHSFSWREVTLMSLVGTSALMIAFALTFTSIFDPVKRSERELEKLAHKYYIEYLYPRALGKSLDQPKLVLENYTTTGLPAVRLNQLLSYNEGVNLNSTNAFSNVYYQCDPNSTTIKYYPVEPYGPKDFTISYNLACERTASFTN